MSGYPDASVIPAYDALDPGRDWAKVRAFLKVKCPWCKARVGHHCTTQGFPLRLGDRFHPSRRALAESQALNG